MRIFKLVLFLALSSQACAMQIENQTMVNFPTVKVAPPVSGNLGPLAAGQKINVSIPNPDAFVIHIESTRYRVDVIKTADDPSPYCEYPLVSDFPCQVHGNQVIILARQ